ncbi:hypothetical protein F0L74_27145 [Chitinophaga agrisoli]|uniref:Uncharacterized protein n=1 Tax=Chitinophaga agrisoli TaxID=2607653 RepID=A0A5B2VLT2_9BACT|nr:hypothetical protein [Chitinophaga agrisoli]KAA2239865.1 hypothetical protein F0L74_27145 [Chitinophaga agrisoli]
MEIAIGIAGLIIAWLTFRKTFYSKPQEEMENLLALFLATQTLSKELTLIMIEYATRRQALDIELYSGITYRSYIHALQQSQKTNLSDELFRKIKNSQLTRSNITTMQKSLELQFEDLQKMKNMFALTDRQA